MEVPDIFDALDVGKSHGMRVVTTLDEEIEMLQITEMVLLLEPELDTFKPVGALA